MEGSSFSSFNSQVFAKKTINGGIGSVAQTIQIRPAAIFEKSKSTSKSKSKFGDFLWISENLEGQNFFRFFPKNVPKSFFQFAEFFADDEENLQKMLIF